MISPKSHHKGDSWKINKVRLVLRLKDLCTRQKWLVPEHRSGGWKGAFRTGLVCYGSPFGSAQWKHQWPGHLHLLLPCLSPLPPSVEKPTEPCPTLSCLWVHLSPCMHIHVYIWPFTSARSLQRICLLTFNNWLEAWLRVKYLLPDWPCFHLLNSCKNGSFWEH